MHVLSSFRLLALSLGLAAAAAPVVAQPSGGPYGPIQQRYEIPQAKHIYYVAPDGAADAAGASLDKPTTLESAIARVVTGDAIILRGGIYRTGSLRLNQGVTIQPYADEHPIVKGTEVATEWTAQSNGLWRTSWTKLFPAKPADWWRRERQGRITPLHIFNNDMLFVDGQPLSAVGGEYEMNENSYYIDYENGQVYLATDPKDRLVEITAHDGAIVRTIRDVHGKKNDHVGPTIRGITFTQYAYRALEVEGTEPMKHMDPADFGKEVVGTTFEHLTISHCSRVAGYFRGDKLTIRHCLVSDCGTEGIYVIDSADVLLERNIVTRTNNAEKISGYYASAVKIFNQSYRVTCRENLIIDNPNASGIWYDVGNVDGVVVNNWFERTNDGFFFEISKGATCAGNVFVDCKPGTRVLNSSNVHLYQNTYVNSAAEFTRTERSAEGDHFGWHPSAGPDVDEREGHVFKNNLLFADDSFNHDSYPPFVDKTFRTSLVRFFQSPAVREKLKNPQVAEMDGNVYVRHSDGASLPLILWGPMENEQGTVAITALEELRALQPKFEKNAVAYPDYRGPLFHGRHLGNFQLLTAFPGSGAGVPLPDKIRKLLHLEPDTQLFPGAYQPE